MCDDPHDDWSLSPFPWLPKPKRKVWCPRCGCVERCGHMGD
nr:MAG TPA: transcription factor IIS-like protein [Caudoviricetes sp.]